VSCVFLLALLVLLPFKVIHAFTGGIDGGSPVAGLILDAQGNLYGSAGNVLFKVDKTGQETVLHTGIGSMGTLVLDDAGDVFGTTYQGGTFNRGTVFELDTTGTATILHNFGGGSDGAYPAAGLIIDASGDLYGTTSQGGRHGAGTVFELNASGVESVLHSFAGPDGSNPFANLIGDASGNLYGTTENGGSSSQCPGGQLGCGVVFKLDPIGRETVLYRFSGGADGSRPAAGLVRDDSGNLFGTTSAGGAFGNGTVFQIDRARHETVLHSFAAVEGVEPSCQLVRDLRGDLYGTTLDGGPVDTGTLFKIDTARAFTIIHNFDGTHDGYFLPAGLARDTHGHLFGITELGGRFGFGTVFEMTP
jgi:uncharacterized repeat protein (TIGR03803 family)